MKFEVYNDNQTAKTTMLRLVECPDCIRLEAVDRYGKPIFQGCILAVCKDGTITMCQNVNPTLGFKLDKHGRVRENIFSEDYRIQYGE